MQNIHVNSLLNDPYDLRDLLIEPERDILPLYLNTSSIMESERIELLTVLVMD
jgi:hypothetical protein